MDKQLLQIKPYPLNKKEQHQTNKIISLKKHTTCTEAIFKCKKLVVKLGKHEMI